MPHGQILTNIVTVFGAALLVACLLRMLRAPTVIGFLLTGIAIGPSGLHLIGHDQVEPLAEIGLVLLLFTVGLELSPDPLVRAGRRLLLAAGVQMTTTTLVVATLVHFFAGLAPAAAAIVGVAAALSSTAIVLKQISERGEAETTTGTLVTGILLLQDVGVILIMLFLPLFAGEGSSWQRLALSGAMRIVGLVGLVAVARYALPWALSFVLRRGGRELMTLFAVVAACAGAWLAGLAEWSWSLGSCIAGLLLAGTAVRHQLIAEIAPFRDVFNALFFISIGMLVDIGAIMPYALPLGVAIVAMLGIKAAIAAGSIGLAGWPPRIGVHVGLSICTVSEFGYILAREAQKLHLLPEGTLTFVTACAVGTMLIGAMLIPVAAPISIAIGRRYPDPPLRDGPESPEPLSGHVVIVGSGLNGRNLARVLRTIGIPYCVIEMNHTLASEATANGDRVVVGDATRMATLEHAAIGTARAVVVAINDPEATRQVVAQARSIRPDLFILARTRYVREIEQLYQLGAQQVIPEEFETSIEILAAVLKEFMIPDNVVEAQIEMIRAGRYGMLRGRPAAPAWREDLLHLLEATATQTFLIARDSPAVGRTIRDLDLRAATGVTVLAIVRSGRPIANPQPDQLLEPGDVLVLVGGHKQLDAAKRLLTLSAQ